MQLIRGSVINSVAITTARHTNPALAFADTMSRWNGEERVLFIQGDDELLENSGATRNRAAYARACAEAGLELRLLALACPDEGAVVLPPTYYLESPLCQEVVRAHRELADWGRLQLLSDDEDLLIYFDIKQARYAKARHFPRYRRAYFSGAMHGLSNLGCPVTSKTRSVGAAGLAGWTAQMLRRAEMLGLRRRWVGDFIGRVQETEQPSFLYENVDQHRIDAGLSAADARRLGVRRTKNRSYLAAYQSQGIWIPQGSQLISPALVPASPGLRYNLRAWRRVFDATGILGSIATRPLAALLRARARPEVSVALSMARDALTEGRPSSDAIVRLEREGLLADLARGFATA